MSMHQLIEQFPQHLTDAIAQGKALTLQRPSQPIHAIVITGMGGSGIAGDLVQQTVINDINIPIVVNKGYTLPQRVNSSTLVIVSSYSGNTEETISAMDSAYQKKAMIVAITAGGQIQTRAQQYGAQVVPLPFGFLPRACFGYSYILQLYILLHLGIINSAYHTDLDTVLGFIPRKQAELKQQADTFARAYINNVMPVIYTSDAMEPVARRFAQQLQENAKILCRVNTIPEMNHNEINGWEFPPRVSVLPVFIQAATDHERVQKRFAITKTIIEKQNLAVTPIQAFADSYVVNALYLIHLTDFISVSVATALNRDPNTVQVIDFLKRELQS